MESILIIPTIQKSRIDTVRFGAEVEEEKDRCLELVSLCIGKEIDSAAYFVVCNLD